MDHGVARRLRSARCVHPDPHAGRRRWAGAVDVRRRVRRRRLLARAEGAVPPVGLRRGAPVAAVRGGRRLLRGRVLLPAPVIDPGHGDDGVEPGSRLDLRRPRVPLDPGVHARRLAQARQQEQRSGSQVLPPRGVRLGSDALRHVVAVRRDRHDGPRRHQRELAGRWDLVGVRAGDRVRADRLRVQDLGGALPPVGTRHLSRCPDAHHRLPVGRVEGGGLRRHRDVAVRRVPDGRRHLAAVHRRDGCAHHDVRQPRGVAPDEHRADARLQLDQPGRVHPDAAGGRGDGPRQGRHPTADRHGHLPDRLRRDEPGCVRGGHRGQPQDAQRRDLELRRADELLAGAGDVDDDLHRVARRDTAARRVDREVLRLQGRDLGRDHVGLRAGGDRSGQLGDRVRLLRHRPQRDVDEAHAGRRHHAHPHADLADGRTRHLHCGDDPARGAPRRRDALRRPLRRSPERSSPDAVHE